MSSLVPQDSAEMQASEENATGSINEEGDTLDQSVPAKVFELFTKMADELKMSVISLAFQKPGIHYVAMKNFDYEKSTSDKYELRLAKLWGDMGASSFYEYNRTYKNLLKANVGIRETDVFVKLWPLSLWLDIFMGDGSERVKYRIDAATDMVCVVNIDFQTRETFGDCQFSEQPSLAKKRMTIDRPALTKELSAFSRVGVLGKIREHGPSKVKLPCPSSHGVHNNDSHRAFTHCSVELAAFFGCFPDLKVAYVLVRPGFTAANQCCPWSMHALYYGRAYFSKTEAERKALGLEMFYDAHQKFVQFTTAFNDKLDPPYNRGGRYFRETLEMLEETRKIFTDKFDELPDKAGAVGVIKHAMSLELREKVEFKLMICGGNPISSDSSS